MSAQVLSRWGVIVVEGDDAITFLQAQLSNDIAGMPESQMRLAGLCTAKGRMLGSFFMLRRENQVFLLCREDTIEALVKRLSMFVLRSKCKVRDARSEFALAFENTGQQTRPMHVAWGETPLASASLRTLQGNMPTISILQSGGLSVASEADDAFEFCLQQLGISYIQKSTVEMFVPQTINFDLFGGVSFSKGCYPGQEVVARSHYLGKVKRRAFQATMDLNDVVNPGADVWLEGKDNEPAGLVITQVSMNGKQHLMVELQVDDAENPNAKFYIKSDNTALSLVITPPPYDVHQKGNQFEQTA